MSIVTGVLQWVLKIFLGGLFNKVMTQIEDQAEHTKEAAVAHAESTEAAATVEVDIVKKQAAVEKAYKDAPKPVDDPFNADRWNKS